MLHNAKTKKPKPEVTMWPTNHKLRRSFDDPRGALQMRAEFLRTMGYGLDESHYDDVVQHELAEDADA